MTPTRRQTFSILLVVALAAVAGVPVRPAAQSAEPRAIDIVARRFVFEPSEIDVAVGERVRLVLTSADGVHGLEIKKFRVKKEIPRGGTPVTIEFTATEAGRFPILCSEYCGDEHEAMTGTLVVHARDVVRSVRLQPDRHVHAGAQE
jgi:cytochrome c oxidase subunit 2